MHLLFVLNNCRELLPKSQKSRGGYYPSAFYIIKEIIPSAVMSTGITVVMPNLRKLS